METKEEKNVRLFPIYKAIAWDLLFFYTILFLFLTQSKGISAADVLLADATYPIFKSILLMPLTILIEKKKKSYFCKFNKWTFSSLFYDEF